MNQILTRTVTEKEIRSAVFAMGPEKAPGPDGMTALFFQRYWGVLKDDLVSLVRGFFQTGRFDCRLNETNICLIPKTENPKRMAELRPISLCNVGYKIISKILCLRLKKILPSIISETQSAFVSGRLITDNILIAQEMFHGLRTNQACRHEFMAIKTDMSKAYDRVEWAFLESVLKKLGFGDLWVSWLMWCVRSVSYKVLFNGNQTGQIIPHRGLRQGDPLSPYLFIICTEVLIANIKQRQREHALSGVKIALRSPEISHLLFADDSLFFCKADVAQCQVILDILKDYGKASGQVINFEKSSVMFGHNVPPQTRSLVKSKLGILKEGGMGSYLGIPESLGGPKSQIFNYIRERLGNRVNGWSSKFLSKGGKEILIKSVALALPNYVMSCFKLPQALTTKLAGAISKFWWSSNGCNRGLHWVAWEKLCLPKNKGGLGFRCLEDFNLALLAKQYWRLIKHPESLMAKVMKGRYFRKVHPLQAPEPRSPSFGWRSIFSTQDLLKQGIRIRIGSGGNTSVWNDPWLPDLWPRAPRGPGREWHPDLLVSQLIHSDTKEWRMPLLRQLMVPEDVELIQAIQPSKTMLPDGPIWHYTKSGQYTVKSGYRCLQAHTVTRINNNGWGPGLDDLKAFAWKTRCPLKIQHFLWQMVSGCLPVTTGLNARGMSCNSLCSHCGTDEETINHIFFTCPAIAALWTSIFQAPDGNNFPTGSVYTNMDFIYWRNPKKSQDKDLHDCLPWFLWFIWKARNQKVFQGTQLQIEDIRRNAETDFSAWKEAQELETTQISDDPPGNADNIGIYCRTDGSWRQQDPTSGLGWVCLQGRNLLMIGAKCHRRSLSPLHSELEALLWAMQEVYSKGIPCHIFETDSTELSNIIRDPDDWPAFYTELQEFHRLRSHYPEFTLSVIPRTKNTQADCLARGARQLLQDVSYVNTHPPNWISNRGVF